MSDVESRVFVVDDEEPVRESLRSLLASVGHAVETYRSVQDFLEAERPDVTGCLVLDVRLPGISGLEFQRDMARAGVCLPVVFITGHGDIPMSVMAMKAGAVEFLTKPLRPQDLLDAVHRGLALDADRRAEMRARAELTSRYAALTPRERQIMALVVAGRLNKQIAGDLALSEITVKVHRAQVMRKMQAASLPDLVRMADRLAAADPAEAEPPVQRGATKV